MTLTIGRACAFFAAGCFIVALCITQGWMDGAGSARDAWALIGFLFSALALAVD